MRLYVFLLVLYFSSIELYAEDKQKCWFSWADFANILTGRGVGDYREQFGIEPIDNYKKSILDQIKNDDFTISVTNPEDRQKLLSLLKQREKIQSQRSNRAGKIMRVNERDVEVEKLDSEGLTKSEVFVGRDTGHIFKAYGAKGRSWAVREAILSRFLKKFGVPIVDIREFDQANGIIVKDYVEGLTTKQFSELGLSTELVAQTQEKLDKVLKLMNDFQTIMDAEIIDEYERQGLKPIYPLLDNSGKNYMISIDPSSLKLKLVFLDP